MVIETELHICDYSVKLISYDRTYVFINLWQVIARVLVHKALCH